MQYRAVLNTSASCTVTFEAAENASPEELLDAIDEADKPTLCNHCSGKSDLTLGDDWEVDVFGGKQQIFKEVE
jgi:hypothetical protein